MMKFKQLVYYVFVISIITFTGCHPLYCTWENGYDMVEKQDSAPLMTGVYGLTPYSKKMMQYEGNYKDIPDSRLYLNHNGLYEITNAPDWLMTAFGESSGHYVSLTGKWNFTCNDETGCILELDGLQTGPLLHVKDHKAAILLTIGDPDTCQGMVYEKLN